MALRLFIYVRKFGQVDFLHLHTNDVIEGIQIYKIQ